MAKGVNAVDAGHHWGFAMRTTTALAAGAGGMQRKHRPVAMRFTCPGDELLLRAEELLDFTESDRVRLLMRSWRVINFLSVAWILVASLLEKVTRRGPIGNVKSIMKSTEYLDPGMIN